MKLLQKETREKYNEPKKPAERPQEEIAKEFEADKEQEHKNKTREREQENKQEKSNND